MALVVPKLTTERPSIAADEVVLYSFSLCPFVQRAAIALQLKKVPHTTHFLSITNKPDWFAQVNSAKKAPVLHHKGVDIPESEIIVDYVQDAFPEHGPSLLPADPIEKAIVRLFVALFREKFIAPLYGLLMSQDEAAQEAQYTKFLAAWRELNNFLVKNQKHGGPFLIGSEFTTAEINSAPFFLRSQLNEYYRHFELPNTSEYEVVRKYRDAVISHPDVIGTSHTKEDLIKLYYDYSLGAGAGSPIPNNGLNGSSSADPEANPLESRPLPPRPARPSYLSAL